MPASLFYRMFILHVIKILQDKDGANFQLLFTHDSTDLHALYWHKDNVTLSFFSSVNITLDADMQVHLSISGLRRVQFICCI